MRPRFGLPAGIALFLGLAPACASTSAVPRAETAAAAPDRSWARTAAFVHVEDDALGWLAAADPRLAIRADTVAPDAMLKHIGTEAILAEDATAQIRGGSLDIFAFRARAHALEQAAKLVRDFRDPLPEAGPLGSTIARPKLERELLARLIEEERTRTDDEAKLGEASGELVRAIVATWKAPSAPQDWLDRDNWLSKHLLEIRDSVRG
ncbi:MAG: hypothetical protein JOZ69_18970, partial [Myxococcales bacterium]|nr:hypothetical protein [Myxococcales bacterium]